MKSINTSKHDKWSTPYRDPLTPLPTLPSELGKSINASRTTERVIATVEMVMTGEEQALPPVFGMADTITASFVTPKQRKESINPCLPTVTGGLNV